MLEESEGPTEIGTKIFSRLIDRSMTEAIKSLKIRRKLKYA